MVFYMVAMHLLGCYSAWLLGCYVFVRVFWMVARVLLCILLRVLDGCLLLCCFWWFLGCCYVVAGLLLDGFLLCNSLGILSGC